MTSKAASSSRFRLAVCHLKKCMFAISFMRHINAMFIFPVPPSKIPNYDYYVATPKNGLEVRS